MIGFQEIKERCENRFRYANMDSCTKMDVRSLIDEVERLTSLNVLMLSIFLDLDQADLVVIPTALADRISLVIEDVESFPDSYHFGNCTYDPSCSGRENQQ